MAEPTGVIRPQPRNAALGAIADALARAHTAAARVQFNPQVLPQFTLADLLPLEGAAGLMQDVAAYGPRALIKGGNAATGGLGTFRPDPRVLDVAEAATYASPLTRLARPAGRLAAQQVERAMSEGRGPLGAALAPVRPLNVMKPKGGNWLAGDLSPEAVAQRLKTTVAGMEPAERVPMIEGLIREQEAAGAVTPEFLDRMRSEQARLTGEAAINKWLDQKLAKYVRNEMATPEDPLRVLAERGVLHFAPENVILDSDTAFQRTKAGFPRHGVAQSQLATDWEALADAQIIPNTAERMLSLMKIRPANPHLRDNPWLAKVPPETPVYGVADRPVVVAEGLGFDHLVDELRNVVRAGSDLPPELRLRPEQLSKVTVPQAVELVDRINKWRAAQKAEADLARSTNAATAEYKAYPTIPGTDRPNERGLRWVELRAPEFKPSTPENLPEGFALSSQRLPSGEIIYDVIDPRREAGKLGAYPGVPGFTPEEAVGHFNEWAARNGASPELETALKYEGEVMGHCVGGYCPDVLEGKSRIFSLRDARGEPHVTIEVKPSRRDSAAESDWFTSQPEAVQDEITQEAIAAHESAKQARTPGEDRYYWGMAVSDAIRKRMGEIPPEIVQIKGKANRAPKEDYLPFVQDFVRSGQWGRVGDLRNTGLTRVGNSYLTAEELKPLVERASRFLEESPALERHRQAFRAWNEYAGTNPSETLSLQRAAGESVHPTIPYTYLELRSILDDPAAFNSSNYDDALGDNLKRIETLRRLLGEEPGYAEGGAVRTDLEGEDQAGVDRMAQQETAASGGYVDYAAGGAVKRAARSLGELVDQYVRKVRKMEELGPASLSTHKLETPPSAEVPGWHITQDLAGILETGAITNKAVGDRNMQGWAPAHVGGAYFYSDPRLARAKWEDLAEMLGSDRALAVEMPIIRAQLRRGNRLAPDEDVSLKVPWQQSYQEGSFATTRPVLINQIDRIYSADPGITKDIIRDAVIRQRRYAEGGAVRTEFEYDPAAVEARAAALMEEIDAA